jgi:type 1 glutamine amidotransferase
VPVAPSALVLSGGWPGHEPQAFAGRYRAMLEREGYRVDVSETLAVLDRPAAAAAFDLIVPAWTMGELSEAQEASLVAAVQHAGTGLAGQHGGMGDAFRVNSDYQWMVGGQFVWHPVADVHPPHRVTIAHEGHPLTDGIPDFDIATEQYYMHVDPSIEVLATTSFAAADHPAGVDVVMPAVWTRRFGRGRVFYCAPGHAVADLDVPELAELVRRGMRWATRRSPA